jgi:hypothetical protein
VIGYIHFIPLYETADYIYTPVSLTTEDLCPKSSSCNTNNETKQKKIEIKDNSIFIVVVFTSITAQHCLPFWMLHVYAATDLIRVQIPHSAKKDCQPL